MFVFLYILGLTQAVEPLLKELHESIRATSDIALFKKWDAMIINELGTLSVEEYTKRFANLRDNFERVKVLNAENTVPGLVFDVSHLDQYSDSEYLQLLNFRAPLGILPAIDLEPTLETEIDWEAKGAVTPVKNQGQCGSCWAFSVIAVTESRWFLEGNQLTAFSEQQIIDCNPKGWECQGGWMRPTLDALPAMHHMKTEDEYPYKARKGVCQADPQSQSQFLISTGRIRQYDFQGIMSAVVNYGVLSIAVDASGYGWRYYRGGLLDKASCAQQSDRRINHAVALVGFGEEDKIQYFRIKNSWSSSWGDKGYIRVRSLENACLVSNHVIVAMHKGDHLPTQKPQTTSTTTTAATTVAPITTATPDSECNPKCKHCEFKHGPKSTMCDQYCIINFYEANAKWCHENCKCVDHGKKDEDQCDSNCAGCERSKGAKWVTDGQCSICLINDLRESYCDGVASCTCTKKK